MAGPWVTLRLPLPLDPLRAGRSACADLWTHYGRLAAVGRDNMDTAAPNAVTAMKRSTFWALVLLTLIATGGNCGAFTKGEEAYTAGDYKAAAKLWSDEAAQGSREAKFRLGLLSELGLGVPANEQAAFNYYLDAAELGQPEAAFSLGVMLDAGTGVAQDQVAAGYWYARAALGDDMPAALSLGLLYQAGAGVNKNLQLAAFWLDQASNTLPAARKALLGNPPPTPGELTAPTPVGAGVFDQNDQLFADLVWTAPDGPADHVFDVQVHAPGQPLWTTQTSASAIRLALPSRHALWRVAQIDTAKGSYAVSPWQRQIANPQLAEPVGIVTILVNPGDSRAQTAAQQMKKALEPSGLFIAVQTALKAAAQSGIQYRYREDTAFAKELANFLPGFATISASQSRSLASGPGEIVVNLVLTSLQPVNK